MRALLLLLMLTACGMDSYRPEVVNAGPDYETDRLECIQYSKDVRSRIDPRSAVIGAGGLGAYGILQATKKPNDPYFMDGYELTDDCMISKGYTLK